MARILFLMIFLVGTAFGIWLLNDGIADVVEAAQSSGWPTTPGEVTRSTIKSSTSSGRHRGTSYTPDIAYTYFVSERTYTGTVTVPGREWGLASSEEVVRLFPQGSKPRVVYSPTDPSKSLLEPGLHTANFGQVMLGLFALTFAAPFGLAGLLTARHSDGKAALRTARKTWRLKWLMPLLILALFVEFFLAIWLSR
jgi:Protein of unknown function (DUF3592)